MEDTVEEEDSVRIKLSRPLTVMCHHRETLVARSAGLERTVCEKCGHVSFSFDTEATGQVGRDRLTRDERAATADK